MAKRNTIDVRILILVFVLIIQSQSLSFEQNKSYKYSYETIVNFNELSSRSTSDTSQKDVGFKLEAECDLELMFQSQDTQLVKLQLTSAAASSVSRSGLEKKLLSLLKRPVYFEFDSSSGKIGTLYIADAESAFCSNIKKGIISLFQAQEQDGTRQEVDVSGECDALYTSDSSSLTKSKENCKNLQIAGQFKNENEMYGVSVTTSSSLKYSFGGNMISSVQGEDRHTVVINAKQGINAFVKSQQTLTLQTSSASNSITSAGSVEDAVAQLFKGKRYSSSLLASVPELETCTENCEKPIDILKKSDGAFESTQLSKIKSGRTFLKLLRNFRGIGKNSIEELMTGSDSYDITAQLIDVAAATQTPASHSALMDLLSFDIDNVEYPERFLFASAFNTHPPKVVLQDVLAKVKANVPNTDLRQSLALGLGAMVHTYCKVEEQCKDEVITDYKNTMTSGLKACKDEECKLLYVESMGNSGLMDFLPQLLDIAEGSKTSMLSFMAIQALRRMPTDIIQQHAKTTLYNIFHQTSRTYDSTVRTAALQYILQLKPSVTDVKNILISAGTDSKNPEASNFIVKRLFDAANQDSYLRSVMDSVMSDPYINNYGILAHEGKSSAFTNYLAVTEEGNSTYGLYVETSNAGVMKRSAMAVDLINKMATQPLLTFGIYAEGLAALIGEGSESSTEAEEPTAGLALTMFDVLLRPVEFFRGSAGLMSAVWSAPSDPVSALQGNILLQDHSQKFHLSNGLIVDLEVLGVASIDLSGSISISLWYKNSHSVITNSGALVIEAALKLESKVLKAGISMSAESESAIDFITDVDFADAPFKMCIQMRRPNILFSYKVEKFEKTKRMKTYKSTLNRRTSSDGLSYLINEKNSIMCSSMTLEE